MDDHGGAVLAGITPERHGIWSPHQLACQLHHQFDLPGHQHGSEKCLLHPLHRPDRRFLDLHLLQAARN